MDAAWSLDFVISNIALCCFVPAGKNKPQFRNRPHHGVMLQCGGELRLVFGDGTTVLSRGGDFTYLPQGSDYCVEIRVPGDCYAINFDRLDTPGTGPFSVRVKDAASMRAMFAEAEQCWKRKQDGDLMRCRSLLYGIFARVQAEQALDYGQMRRIRPAVDRIREQFAEERLTIADLAARCGITPEYFRSLFRRQFGVSPLKYINALRVNRAEELLQTGLYTVSEAASLSGFGNLSQFSREFKKQRGVPPSSCLRDN